MKRTLSFALILITTVMAVFIILKQNYREPQTKETQPPEELKYSWQIFNSQTWQQNTQDLSRQIYLTSTVINYQAEKNLTQFAQPFVIISSLENIHVIQSQQAFLANETELTFLNDVIINRYPRKLSAKSSTESLTTTETQNKTLLTDKITYNTATQRIHTLLPVIIKLPQTKLSGTGFEADLQTGHYQLLSAVRTFHEPN